MKKLFTIAYAALLTIYVPAQAQTQETTLARSEHKKNAKKTGDDRDRKRGNDIQKAETIDQRNQTLRVELINTSNENYKSGKSTRVNNKVGPNGEELFMKRRKYYYLDNEGKKVKVKSSKLMERPKHS